MGYVIAVAGRDATAFIPRLREIAAAVDPEATIQNGLRIQPTEALGDP